MFIFQGASTPNPWLAAGFQADPFSILDCLEHARRLCCKFLRMMESNQQIKLAELQKKDHFGSRILAQMVRWFKSLQRLALLPMMTSLQLALTSFDSCNCTRGTFSFEQPDNKSRGRPVRSHSDWGEGWHGFEDPWDWTFPNRVDFQRARSLGSLLRSPSRNWKLKTTLFFWAPASRPMPRGGQKMLLMISMSWLSFSTTLIAYLWDIELSCDLSEVRSFQSSHSILNSTRGPVWLLKHLRQELWKPFGASDPCEDLHLCFSVSLVTLWIFIHNLPLLELLFVTLCRGAMRIQPFTNFGKRFCSVVRWFLMDLLTCSLKQLVFLVWPWSLHSSCLGLSFHLRLFWTLPLVVLKLYFEGPLPKPCSLRPFPLHVKTLLLGTPVCWISILPPQVHVG